MFLTGTHLKTHETSKDDQIFIGSMKDVFLTLNRSVNLESWDVLRTLSDNSDGVF